MDIISKNLCCGCLSSDRRLIEVQDYTERQCFLQIINEIMMSHPSDPPGLLCWECNALLRNFTKFKERVKHSYRLFINYSDESTLKSSQVSSRLSQRKLYDISIDPDESDELESIQIIKQEDDSISEPLPLLSNIKEEKDNTSAYSDNCDDGLLIEFKSKKKKIKDKYKNSKKEEETLEIYREIELTPEELVEVLEEERRLLVSREDYVNAMFRCEKCIVTFPNADDLKDHIRIKHELNASNYKCDICERSFSSIVSYNYHASKHARRYECCACGERTTSKRDAVKHYENVHCCGVEFPYKAAKLDQNGLSDDCTKQECFPCEFCNKSFRWKTSLRKHVETHKIESGQKRKPYCEPCRLSFTTTSNLQKHVKTSSKHQIQLKLWKLGSATEGKDKQEAHIEQIKCSVTSSMQVYPCPQCDKKFQWRGNLARHLHSHAARAKGELVCKPCNRTFSSIATYKQHMKISKKHVTENDFKYMCSDCGKRFANKTRLKDHIDWEHLKNYTHTCTVCQKIFKSHTSLYLHKQVVHKKDNAEHLCDQCGRAFPNHAKLRSHITALHSGATPYKCTTCSARFSWHSCLSRHMRRVHPRRKTDVAE